MKQEPDELPGELFFDGQGFFPRLVGPPVIVLLGVKCGWDFRWVYDLIRSDPLIGSIGIVVLFSGLFGFFIMTFAVHQVRINVPARTYSLQRGFWPFDRTITGTLDDVEIHLTTGSGRQGCAWVSARLEWKDNGQPPLHLWSEYTQGSVNFKSIIPAVETDARDLAARLQVPVRIGLGP